MAATAHKERFTATVGAASASVNVEDRLGIQSRYYFLNLDSSATVTVDPWNGTAAAYGDDMLTVPPGAWRSISRPAGGQVSMISTAAGTRVEVVGGNAW